MDQESREKLVHILKKYINKDLLQATVSNPVQKDGITKVRLRPLLLKGVQIFQSEEQRGTQAFHKNLKCEETIPYLLLLLEQGMKQLELTTSTAAVMILLSKKRKVTIKEKKHVVPKKISPNPDLLSHNRRKRYILEEGIPVPFLVDLGVMTAEGKIVRTKYDKYRQINRFLEFIEDILPKLERDREMTIIDFGCGKSYLTFAMYYYLNILKGYSVRIIGLDLKHEVIEHCMRLGQAYGYEKLNFCYGDIASFEGVEQVDMVVTLHACDTATDYAIAKAVRWNAKVILSVPCCQHELNRQMDQERLAPLFQYGLIKERAAALFTDAIRAQILEGIGYRTQILEFVDLEHTPKNILIRAVRQGKRKENATELRCLLDDLHVYPTLAKLLPEAIESPQAD